MSHPSNYLRFAERSIARVPAEIWQLIFGYLYPADLKAIIHASPVVRGNGIPFFYRIINLENSRDAQLDNRIKALWDTVKQDQSATTYVHEFMTHVPQSIKACEVVTKLLTSLTNLQYVSLHPQEFDYILMQDERLFLKGLNFSLHERLKTLAAPMPIILNILKDPYGLVNYEEPKKRKEDGSLLRMPPFLKVIIVDNFEEGLTGSKFLVLLERYIRDTSSLERITLFPPQPSQSPLMQSVGEVCTNEGVEFWCS